MVAWVGGRPAVGDGSSVSRRRCHHQTQARRRVVEVDRNDERKVVKKWWRLAGAMRPKWLVRWNFAGEEEESGGNSGCMDSEMR